MSLVPRLWLGDLELTDYPFLFEFGGDFGHAANVATVIASLLRDGEIESLNRRSNRTIVLPVLIEGADLAEVAEAEAALVAECDKQQNTLTFDPGDGFGATTVFDTFAAEVERVYSDSLEVATLRRLRLTIRALPYGRSQTLVVDDAGTPPLSGGTLLYNCESPTGWGGWGGNSPTVAVDNAIYAEGAGSLRTQVSASFIGSATYSVYFYWYAGCFDEVTGLSIDTDTGGYLSMDVRPQYGDVLPDPIPQPGLKRLYMQVDSEWVEVPSFVATEYLPSGFVRYAWPVDADLTVTGFRTEVIQVKHDNSGSAIDGFANDPYTWYDEIELLPSATTDHQIIKQLTVQGSARTPASLRVAAPSESIALDQVFVATMPTSEIPAGFQPDGARWATQGATTPDATAIAGLYYTPDADYSASSTPPARPIFNIPVGMLTAGPYTMIGLVKAESSSLNFGVQAQLNVDGTLVGPTSEAEVSPTGLTNGWQFVTVGTVYLPPLPVQGADATTTVRLLFKGAKMADVYFIPAWQVGGAQVADFSIVSCGDGTVEPGGASSSLWIDSPSTSQPQGGWWRGPTDDRLNAQSAWPDAKNPGVHTFAPGGLTAFVVSTGAAGPTLTLSYFPAWVGMAVI